jgi:tetratricopeptide (TPR) repeat protein
MVSNGNPDNNDHIAVSFRSYAQNILVVVLGLLPLLFIPVATAPYEYTKFFLVVLGVFVAIVLFALSILRSGTVPVGISYPLIALWGVVFVTFISSLFSGDLKDSLVGDFFSIHSAVFVAMLALIPTVWVMLQAGKRTIIRIYTLLALSTLALVIFHVLRLMFGPDFLTLGVFTAAVSTPIGGWNDLALFLGLTVIISLVALEQLSLRGLKKALFVATVVLSLGMLAVINFFVIWLVLGLTSLAIVVYSLRRGKADEGLLPLVEPRAPSKVSLMVSLIVFIVSLFFVIGGASLGGAISKKTQISYVEVRPSLEATADIARQVYRENAFFGIGANKFTDAWRLYKDDSINLTPFWNTDFNAGNGYIPTFFVTTGILGGVMWLLFITVFFVAGLRRLLSAPLGDRVWYFIAVSSFVSAVYIWGMSIVYVPGVVILLLGALVTGISLAALNTLSGAPTQLLMVSTTRRTGFMLTLGVIVIVIGSVSILYVAVRHYSSVYAFNESISAMQSGVAIDTLEEKVFAAYQMSSSDVFARRIAEYQFARMNDLMGRTSLTEDDQEQFRNAYSGGINAAGVATQLDRTEPLNWSILGGIYSALASLNVEGAHERAVEAFTRYKELNPKNPLPYLELAIVESRAGNHDVARVHIEKALALKPDYTEAYFLLSQLEIATGNVDAAVRSTRAVVSLEPANPVRYYQLGVLESFRKNPVGAAEAFEVAVALDENYSNARYLLALVYDELGRNDEAKQQLEAVQRLNPENADVANLIRVIEEEGSLNRLRSEANRTIPEGGPVTSDSGTVSTTAVGDSPLLTPVNTAPRSEERTETGE